MLPVLYYADDLVLICRAVRHLKTEQEGNKVGLRMNPDKTKYLIKSMKDNKWAQIFKWEEIILKGFRDSNILALL